MWIKIECVICNKEIKYTDKPQLSSLVTSLLNTSSESQQSGIKAWEEEINPCEHTLTLYQYNNITIEDKLTARCNLCQLSSNLWLCLTCGNLSCGRKETGGNGHAIEHFTKRNHPLVVKTGTITPNGEASIYCYTCDKDVKDPNLGKHLLNFGIDVTSQVKTDKTVSEMNLEVNLNLTLSKTIEDGKVLIPLYGPSCTGMENLGNSCYINSVVQIFFSLEQFKQWYYDNAIDHLNQCIKNAAECYLCQMSKIMYGLHSGMYSIKQTRQLPQIEDNKEGEIEEYQKGIKPSSFKMFFGKNHPEFSSNRQQDAFEYLTHLFQIMTQEEKRFDQNNPLSLFEFEVETRLQCGSCNGVKYNTAKTWYLTLSVNDWKNNKSEDSECTMEDCIKKYISEEEVLEVDCPYCKIKRNWIKTNRILNFPKYLIVIFARFVFDWVPVKLEVKFKALIDDCDLSLLQKEHKFQNERLIVEPIKEPVNKVVKVDQPPKKQEEKEEEKEKEPTFNENDLNNLLQCGIPELGAKWALLKNDNNPDMALGWYCDHSEDAEIKGPLPKIKSIKSAGSSSSSYVPDEATVQSMISLGFTRAKVVNALKKNNSNFDNALDYLFANPDEEPIEIDEEKKIEPLVKQDPEEKEESLPLKALKPEVPTEEINKANTPNYNLYSYLTHLGKNAAHGHYVCHIRDGNSWKYFNDAKVTRWDDPPIHKGYIYLYKNKAENK